MHWNKNGDLSKDEFHLLIRSMGLQCVNQLFCAYQTPSFNVACPTAFVSFYLSFRAITNIHRQQSRHQAPHCSYRKSFSSKIFLKLQNLWSKKYFWSQMFLVQSRIGMLVCLSSVAAAYRSTMEHFPRTSLSSLTNRYRPFSRI